MSEQLTSGDLDRIEAAIRQFDEDGGGKAEYLELYVSAADVLRLVAALRAAWGEANKWRDEYDILRRAVDRSMTMLRFDKWDAPDRSAASDEARGEGG